MVFINDVTIFALNGNKYSQKQSALFHFGWNLTKYLILHFIRPKPLHCLALFRMGFFGVTHGCREEAKKPPLPPTLHEICCKYPKMMKLGPVIHYLKKIQKIFELCNTPLDFYSLFFHWKSAHFTSQFKFNNLGVALDLALKFYISLAKGLRIKLKTFSLLIPTFLEVSVDKLVGEWGEGVSKFCKHQKISYLNINLNRNT